MHRPSLPSARRTIAAAVAGPVLASAALTGCSGRTAPAAAEVAAPAPRGTPGPAAADLAGRAAGSATTATYRLTRTDGTTARVVASRSGSALRLDLVRGADTDSLLLTAAGQAVSCRVSGKAPTCLTVAGPGQPLPRLFDPGLERVMTTTLTYLAAGVATARPAPALPAAGGLPAARCFEVAGAGVDPGTYCLTDAGLVRRATFPSGTLDLVAVGAPPAPATFVPPVRPVPLPTSTHA